MDLQLRLELELELLDLGLLDPSSSCLLYVSLRKKGTRSPGTKREMSVGMVGLGVSVEKFTEKRTLRKKTVMAK